MLDEILLRRDDPISVLQSLSKYFLDKPDIQCEFFESSEDVRNPNDNDKSKRNLMILSDLLVENQNTCEKYYVLVDIVM